MSPPRIAVFHPNRPLPCLLLALALLLGLAAPLRADGEKADAKKADAGKSDDKKSDDKANPAERFRKLRALFRENPQQAAKGFRELIEQYPESDLMDEFRYWRARSLEGAKAKPEEVIEAYQAVIDKHPKSDWADDAMFAIAEIKSRQVRRREDCRAAIEAYKAFIKRWPTDDRVGEAKLTIGELYRRMGKHDESMTWYRKVLTDHPKSAFTTRARMQLARALYRQGKVDDALCEYRTLLKAKLSDNERIEARLGVLDCQLRRKDGLDDAIAEAREIRDEAIRKKALEDYADLATRTRMANYYMRQKRFDEAEAEYQAYIDRFKTSVGVWQSKLNIGIIRLEAKRYPHARKMFDQVIAKFEKESGRPPWYLTRAMYYEGVSYQQEGRFDEARKCFEKLVEKYPHSYDARRVPDRLEQMEKAEKDAKAKKDEKKPDPKKKP